MGVSADAPSLDSAYKLVEYAGRPVMKLSPGKQTLPGPKQVYRGDLEAGDVLATRSEPPPHGWVPLLSPVMRSGERTTLAEPVAVAADRLSTGLAGLPASARRLKAPTAVAVRVSDRPQALTLAVRESHLPTAVDG